MPANGGSEPARLVAVDYLPTSLAFDGAQLWFPDAQRVARAPVDGGSPIAVTAGRDGFDTKIAVDGAHVYFETGTGGSVYVADKVDGAAARMLARFDGAVGDLAADGGNLYLLYPDGDGTHIGRMAATGGGKLVPIAEARGFVSGITVSGDSIFWAQWDDGAVYRACK